MDRRVGVELMPDVTDRERARIAQAAMKRTIAPDGPIMERFDAAAMAAALEQEAMRADYLGKATGTPGKVDVHMDPRDALLLAKFLRRHGGK